jgi:uncharacterized protein YjiS (DUF1127 family)
MMTTTNTHLCLASERPVPQRSALQRPAWRRVADAIVVVFEAFLEARAMRLALRDLHGFDDRMLADLGISRSGIEAAVRDGGPERRRTQPAKTEFRLAA